MAGKAKDEIGNRYGYLVVLRQAGIGNDNCATWVCRCDCGTEVVRNGRGLRGGATTSCGCTRGKSRFIYVGDRFERLVVEGLDRDKRGRQAYRCRCDCGEIKLATKSELVKGRIKSCGCLHVDTCREKNKTYCYKHGFAVGKERSFEYRVWNNIKERCFNPNHAGWDYYGGAGVTICDEWKDSFPTFLEHVGKAPSESHSIDRFPDRTGNYEPGNVRWATAKEQARNRSSNVLVTHPVTGETHTIAGWAEILGMRPSTLYKRLSSDITLEQALDLPVGDFSIQGPKGSAKRQRPPVGNGGS